MNEDKGEQLEQNGIAKTVAEIYDSLLRELKTPSAPPPEPPAQEQAAEEHYFTRDAPNGDNRRKGFRREALTCCVNGRTTRRMPCRGLPNCALRKQEQEAAQSLTQLPREGADDYTALALEEKATREKYITRDIPEEKIMRRGFRREGDERGFQRGRGRGGRTRRHGL